MLVKIKRATEVFPTPVGVFPSSRERSSRRAGLPHARGGVSQKASIITDPEGSSPRPWGCFR